MTAPAQRQPLGQLLYSLDEVAVATGLPKRGLEHACRAGRIDHVHINGHRRMTRAQVDALIETGTRRGTDPRDARKAVEDAELAAALEALDRNASRATPRRRRAAA